MGINETANTFHISRNTVRKYVRLFISSGKTTDQLLSLSEEHLREIFVAILPFSHYTYCEAVWSQRKEDLIRAWQNAFLYFEGVTAAIVPDNLKAAVTRSDRNEPVINEEFAAFAEHYGCAVYPARVRHPKDKALVENTVKLLYRSVYLDIEEMTFTSLDALNTAIHISLHDFNEKPMAGRGISRKDMFLKGEKDFLRECSQAPWLAEGGKGQEQPRCRDEEGGALPSADTRRPLPCSA